MPTLLMIGTMLLAALTTGTSAGATPAVASSSVSIYVSPSGDDDNPGTSSEPLQTLARAQHVVRAHNEDMSADITVYLENGTYRLSQPLLFNSRDSGTNGFNVVWTSAPGATPLISGADQITGWTESNPARDIWSASVPDDLNTRQIYVDGVRAQLATGAPPVSLVRSGNSSVYTAGSSVMSHWRNPSDIDFVYSQQIGQMAEQICPVASIDGASIQMAQPCWNNSTMRLNGDTVAWGRLATPNFIENAYELLDQPGEFYLDGTAHTVYYIPRSGQNMASADVEAPTLEMLFEGVGTASQPIHNISFSNLQFSYATWLMPGTPTGFAEIQAGYTITGNNGYDTEGLCQYAPHGTCPYGAWTKEPGNVQFTYDQNLSFINDRFVHLGAAGLNLDNGSQRDLIQGCVFTDISGNGIEIGNVNLPEASGTSRTEGIVVTDNHVYGQPAEYHGGVGILAGYVSDTTITHNQVDHTGYIPISIGWAGWLDKRRDPPTPNNSQNDVISDNLIFDFMENMADGGGVYTQGILGHSMGSGLKVTGNVIHDQLHWGAGLKSDNGTSYVTYTGNVLYNDTYDWVGPHWDYRGHPGTHHPKKHDPVRVTGNWWQQGGPHLVGDGQKVSSNTIITGPSDVPGTVLATAGIQSPFQSMLSWQPAGDAAPNPPQAVTVLAAFQGDAWVTWHPSYVEGSSPVSSYTLTTCLAPTAMSQGVCANPVVQPLMVPASTLAQTGYAEITGLADGQSYDITVTASNSQGTSAASVPTQITPVASPPKLPGPPTNLTVKKARGIVSLLWYRPSSDSGIRLMTDPAGSSHPSGASSTANQRGLVLGYIVTCSNGQQYDASGDEEIVLTNTGSRTVQVVGGLSPHKSYTFSVSAVGPSGTGPPAQTGAVTPSK